MIQLDIWSWSRTKKIRLSVLLGIRLHPKSPHTATLVASPKIIERGGIAYILTSSEQQYLMWDTASRSAKRKKHLEKLGARPPRHPWLLKRNSPVVESCFSVGLILEPREGL